MGKKQQFREHMIEYLDRYLMFTTIEWNLSDVHDLSRMLMFDHVEPPKAWAPYGIWVCDLIKDSDKMKEIANLRKKI